jgi:DNA-binding NtrC family response regulator
VDAQKNILLRIVVVDDDPQNLDVIRTALEGEPIELIATSDSREGLELIRLKRPNIVLVELVMPQLGGMEMLEKIVEMDPGTDVILMTAHYTPESAVEAIKKGAYDYLTKPISVAKLRSRIEQLLSNARVRQHSLQLERELVQAFQFEGMIGRSPLMLDLFRKIRQIAPHFRTALLIGDTGTGKELVAKALHDLSPVSAAPFVTCNCSALVETLFESELFGYVKGAFTGATQDRVGLFEYANGGTLMLDEIGDLPLGTQAKLLRVLQNQEIQRVGSPKVIKVDVRVIAATHCDLAAMVAKKEFREDLYYRLSMMQIKLPALVERKEDLSLLQHHFLRSYASQYNKEIRGLTRRAQAVLNRYSWPGKRSRIAKRDRARLHGVPERRH